MSNDLTISTGDGWDDDDAGNASRIIQGALYRCVDGAWSEKDGTPIPKGARMLAVGMLTGLQRWLEQKPIETIIKQAGKPLPDIDELNAEHPEDNWELGIDGKPRPPWQWLFVVYLLNESTAERATFANGTTGARIAVENLKDKIKWMRALRGASVVSVVEFTSKPMATKFGPKQRPEFKVVEWRQLGPAPQTERTLEDRTVKPVTIEEELDDEIPI